MPSNFGVRRHLYLRQSGLFACLPRTNTEQCLSRKTTGKTQYFRWPIWWEADGTSKQQRVPTVPCINQEFRTPQAARMPKAMALKSPIRLTGLPKLIAFFGIASHGGLEGERTMVMPPAL